MKYKVHGGRQGEPSKTYATFNADSDEEARKIFRSRFANRPEYKWDHYSLLRVDRDPVPEKTTFIAEVGRIPDDEWSL